jgi:hypothetical protein
MHCGPLRRGLLPAVALDLWADCCQVDSRIAPAIFDVASEEAVAEVQNHRVLHFHVFSRRAIPGWSVLVSCRRNSTTKTSPVPMEHLSIAAVQGWTARYSRLRPTVSLATAPRTGRRTLRTHQPSEGTAAFHTELLFAPAKPNRLERGTKGFLWLDSTSRFERAVFVSAPICTTARKRLRSWLKRSQPRSGRVCPAALRILKATRNLLPL